MLQQRKAHAHIVESDKQAWFHDNDPEDHKTKDVKDGTTFKAALPALKVKGETSGSFLDTCATIHVSRKKRYIYLSEQSRERKY